MPFFFMIFFMIFLMIFLSLRRLTSSIRRSRSLLVNFSMRLTRSSM